jgi:hypothetical protein
MAWLGLGASLAWNYAQHRRHRATICSVSRRLPRRVVLPVYAAGAVSLGVHVARGYRAIVET